MDPTLQQMFQSLQSLASEYAPAAYQTALNVKRVEGTSNLVIGLLALFALIWLIPRRKKITLTAEQARRRVMLEDEIYLPSSKARELEPLGGSLDTQSLAFMGRVFGACFAAVGVAVTLLSLWNWIALTNPALALAHDLLSRVAQ